jgi:hypothetical protein
MTGDGVPGGARWWCVYRVRLRGDALAALTTTGRDDRAAGAGVHTGTEAVLARATTVVGLESTLALGHGTHSFKLFYQGRDRGSVGRGSQSALRTATAVRWVWNRNGTSGAPHTVPPSDDGVERDESRSPVRDRSLQLQCHSKTMLTLRGYGPYIKTTQNNTVVIYLAYSLQVIAHPHTAPTQ